MTERRTDDEKDRHHRTSQWGRSGAVVLPARPPRQARDIMREQVRVTLLKAFPPRSRFRGALAVTERSRPKPTPLTRNDGTGQAAARRPIVDT